MYIYNLTSQKGDEKMRIKLVGGNWIPAMEAVVIYEYELAITKSDLGVTYVIAEQASVINDLREKMGWQESRSVFLGRGIARFTVFAKNQWTIVEQLRAVFETVTVTTQ